MNFNFNEDPDRVSKNLVLCLLHFTNKAQLKDNAVPTILDPTVVTIALSFLTDCDCLIRIELFMRF